MSSIGAYFAFLSGIKPKNKFIHSLSPSATHLARSWGIGAHLLSCRESSQFILGMTVKKPVRNPLSLRIFELTKRDKKYRIKFFKNDIWGAEAADK